jgi:beta-lactamase class D
MLGGTSPKTTDASMDRLSQSLLQLFTRGSEPAGATIARPEWQAQFSARGVRGTFALYEPTVDRWQVCDEARARERFLPAATFGIALALAGIEEGAIADEHEVFRWDGRPKTRRDWERDHTLGSGIAHGVAWMFQEVARRIGRARMREWLERLAYGNRDLGGGIELFWLQGALRVSAREQVAFLHRLSEGRLPATQRAQRLVRAALVVEKTREHTLYALAGAGPRTRDPLEWRIGWSERKGRPMACYAMNFTSRAPAQCTDGAAIARSLLRQASGSRRA